MLKARIIMRTTSVEFITSPPGELPPINIGNSKGTKCAEWRNARQRGRGFDLTTLVTLP